MMIKLNAITASQKLLPSCLFTLMLATPVIAQDHQDRDVFVSLNGSAESRPQGAALEERDTMLIVNQPKQLIPEVDMAWRYVTLKHLEIQSGGQLSHHEFLASKVEEQVLIQAIESAYSQYSTAGTERISRLCENYFDPENPLSGELRATRAFEMLQDHDDRISEWKGIYFNFLEEISVLGGTDLEEKVRDEIDYYGSSTESISISTTRDFIESQGMDRTAYIFAACTEGDKEL